MAADMEVDKVADMATEKSEATHFGKKKKGTQFDRKKKTSQNCETALTPGIPGL